MNEDYEVVRSYTSSTRDPQANIFKSEFVKDPAAPTFAYFSGRGPNDILNNIIKPDITAPGVEIVAVYSAVSSPTPSSEDKRRVKYNMLFGTSLSCPHAAAAAAYVKSF
ncbi:subtilisin-like protease SBT4.4 [Malus domestica]|uniref:subtilisin-like protease SBT4.4 n=1 Tax=Malus domestica TaxID=3750 RepID=UPI003975F36C